jgi:hypothetical protein
MAAEEQVPKYGAGFSDLGMAVKCVRYALDSMEFCRDACGAQFAEEIDAGFQGNGDVFGAVEEDGRGPSC